MKDRRKRDYLKFLILKVLQDLSRYDLQDPDIKFLEDLLKKILSSQDPLKIIFIISRTRGLERTGRYFFYILKKLDEGLIKYEDLSRNLNADTDFIEKEILNYFSNPPEKNDINEAASEESDISIEPEDELYNNEHDFASDEEAISIKPERKFKKEPEDTGSSGEVPGSRDRKNYLELIRTESDIPEEDESVYELPLPGKTDEELQSVNATGDIPEGNEDKSSTLFEDSEKGEKEEHSSSEIEEADPSHSAGVGTGKIKFSKKKFRFSDFEEEPEVIEDTEKETSSSGASTILEDEVSEILDEYKQEEEILTAEAEKPTNAVFQQYEEELKKSNELLAGSFDEMIEYLMTRNKDPERREKIIKNILEVSSYLEDYSRKLSLEIISNIYQTIMLSFEKISEGKYDVSDETLKLFKSSLDFVIKLIKGEEYYLYEETLKSIENLRSILLEEKLRKERELLAKKEKQELELMLLEKYPGAVERERVKELKRIIGKTEERFNSLEKVTGEYQVYEALRELSGNLTYFKKIVNLALDLDLPKLAQLSEGSYIFIKFLQNYRINPINTEIKEIFNYITHNLKMLIFGKHLRDLDLFISYLNDPVKIFTKPEKEKK